MSYRPIVLPEAVHPELRRFVANRVDLYLHDVHAMLRLPLPSAGLTAGCGFALGQVLLSTIAGLARVAQPNIYKFVPAMSELLRHYPDESTITGAVTGKDFNTHLCEAYRNILTHSFGVNVQWPPEATAWQVEPMSAGFKVSTAGGLLEQQIEELENPTRPAWLLQPTLKFEGRTYVLSAEALYWGTRELVHIVMTTEPFATGVRSLLGVENPVTSLGPGGVTGIQYHASTAVSSTSIPVLQQPTNYWKG